MPGGFCLAEQSGEGVNEAGVGELEAGSGELGRVGAGTREQDFVSDFTEGQAESEGWDGEESRAVELGSEGACELGVRGRIGRSEVNGAFESGRVEEEKDGGQGVGERDPAHVLTTVAEPATQAEAEDGQQTRECAICGVEYNAEAEVEDADASVDGGPGCCLPLLAALGQKTGAERRGFVEELVAAIAVNAGGRGDKERPGRMAEVGKSRGKDTGGVDAAIGNFAFVIRGPAVSGKVSAGEMDGCGEVFEAL